MRILFATDGSEGARAASQFLRGLALPGDARIHIVTVTETQDVDALLQAAAADLEGLAATVTTEALFGNSTPSAIEAILAAGDALEADFIVVGADGHPAVIRLFTGSVADGIARRAHRSVVIVRPDSGSRLEAGTVVVGIDSAPRSRDIVLWTSRLFPLPPSCALRLVAVVPSQTWTKFVVPSPSDPTDPSLRHETIRIMTLDQERERAESWMESLAREAGSAAADGDTSRQITTEVRQGTTADELIRAAAEAKAALIVVGSHDRTAIDRFLLGSVSEGVLRHSPCSVLISKLPAPAD
jgi:nucleotide-binding universal stress UspA family protein